MDKASLLLDGEMENAIKILGGWFNRCQMGNGRDKVMVCSMLCLVFVM